MTVATRDHRAKIAGWDRGRPGRGSRAFAGDLGKTGVLPGDGHCGWMFARRSPVGNNRPVEWSYRQEKGNQPATCTNGNVPLARFAAFRPAAPTWRQQYDR